MAEEEIFAKVVIEITALDGTMKRFETAASVKDVKFDVQYRYAEQQVSSSLFPPKLLGAGVTLSMELESAPETEELYSVTSWKEER